MTIDNLIIIKGGNYSDVKKALKQWLEIYSNDLTDKFAFKLYRNGYGNHLIKTEENLDNELFYFLINYLMYPEGINYTIDVKGFTTGKDENILKTKKLLVYISSTDVEFDNVSICTRQGQNYLIDFGGKLTEIESQTKYIYPNALSFSNPDILKVNKQKKVKIIPSSSQNNNPRTSKIEKRFKKMSQFLFLAFFLSYFSIGHKNIFLLINCGISACIWGWFFFDYKMLQLNQLYLKNLLFAFIVFLYGIYLGNNFSMFSSSKFVTLAHSLPILFLSIQWPLRYAFKKFIKREPVIDKPAPTMMDFIYLFVLLTSTFYLPMLLLLS